MSLCFLFAGSALTKAETPASLVVLDGASVYVSNNANESGIKFDVEILKTDYQALVENNAGSDIYLGVDVIRATSGTVLGSYDVNTDGELRTSKDNANNYAYNFAIIYNEVSYIEGLISSGTIEDTADARANAINKMYTDELAVRPFYKVVPAEGEAVVEYGAIGDSRSMIHVANAEVVAGAELPANFASTYIAEQIVGGEVEVDAIGRITGDVAAEIKTFTKGTSAEVVAREDAVIEREFLAGLNVNDEFNLYGFTADRKVYSYTAKYVGAAGMEAVAFAEEVLVAKDTGKVFLNGTALAEEEVLDVFYNGESIFVDGAVDASALAGVDMATAFELEVLTTANKYAVSNAKLYDKVWENTEESRRDMAAFFSTYTGAGAVGPKELKTLDGYYALAEDLVFVNVASEEEQEYTFKETFYSDPGHAYTFAGTFDGRGFAMYNSGAYGKGGMFGLLGSNATIKNVAIINPVTYAGADSPSGFSIKAHRYGVSSVILFHGANVNTGLTNINISDVYVEYTTAHTTNESVFVIGNVSNLLAGENQVSINNFIINRLYIEDDYTPTTWVDENADGRHDVVDNALFNEWTPSRTLGTNVSVTNTYMITFGRTCGAGGWHLNNFVNYKDYEDFGSAANGLDLKSFENDNWIFNDDGAPTWKSVQVVPQILDAEDKAVKEISYGANGATDSLFYTANVWTSKGVQKAVITTNDAENIIINGNSIEVKPGKYTATITVANEDGSVSKTFNVIVDTSVPEDFNEEVLYSKATGKVLLNGTSIEGSEIIKVGEYDFSQVVTGTSISGLVLYTDNQKYNLTNVLVCDDAFADTHEDRVRFVNLFTYASKTITGYYALAENITFDHFTGASGAYDNSETFRSNRDVDNVMNIYQATFDGRGYTMKNIGVADRTLGIFGNIADGAVIKNIAFVNVVSNTSASDNGKTGDFWSFLFNTYTSASDKFTLENVYIENTLKVGDYRTDMGYKSTAIMDKPPQTSDYPIGSGTFTNVIINYMGYDANGNLVGTFDENGNITGGYASMSALTASLWDYNGFGDDCHINNSHVITNGYWHGGLQGNWYHATSSRYNSRGECFGEFGSYQSFVNGKDKIGVETFSDKYWTINDDGVPVWTTATQIPQILDAEGEKVGEIVYKVEGATESLFYIAGLWTYKGVLDATVSCDNENVVISGNSIEVKPGKYTATIVVANADGSVVKEFEVVVNTNLPEDFAEEVLLDKTTGQLFFQGTSFAGKSASIDTSIIDENQAVNTSFELGVVLVDGEKYNLTNVKMYDRVWENTRESRQDFVDFFATGDNTSTDNVNPKDPVTLSGYYTIAEDITFSHYADGSTGIQADKDTTISEMLMHKANNVYNLFKGTFDGRGHVMSDVGFYTAFSIFGVAGEGATIKNVAINNVARYVGWQNIQYQPNGGGIFFTQPEALNTNVYWENVFVNISGNVGSNGGSVLYYTTVGGLTWGTAEGQLTWVDGKTTYNGVEFDSAKGGGLGLNHMTNVVVNVAKSEGDVNSYCVTNKGGTFYGWNVEEELNNVIFITNGRVARALSDINSKAETKHVKYENYDAFVAAKASHDFTTFNSTYWEVNADGVIAWKGLDYAKLPAVEPAE